MNEKRIYEWLRSELKGLEWQRTNGADSREYATWYQVIGSWQYLYLPPLDYNTLFNEVIPQLKAEGITMWFDGRLWYLNRVGGIEYVWGRADWREALDALLEAREEK